MAWLAVSLPKPVAPSSETATPVVKSDLHSPEPAQDLAENSQYFANKALSISVFPS